MKWEHNRQHKYQLCGDCDAQAQYHRENIPHCSHCGWPDIIAVAKRVTYSHENQKPGWTCTRDDGHDGPCALIGTGLNVVFKHAIQIRVDKINNLANRDADTTLGWYATTQAPDLGELLNFNGEPYIVFERGWAADRGDLGVHCYLRVK